MTGVDEWLAQVNTMWVAALSLLPFSFVVLFVPTTANGHIAYICVWVVTLALVAFTSYLLSRAVRARGDVCDAHVGLPVSSLQTPHAIQARRLSPLREGNREYRVRAFIIG